MDHRRQLAATFIVLSCFYYLVRSDSAHAFQPTPIRIEVSVVVRGTDRWDWWQARSAYIPGENPYSVTTMSETGRDKSHDFHDIYQMLSEDYGKSWSAPTKISSLQRVAVDDGYEVAAGDLWPVWHAGTNTVLTTGKTFNFKGGTRETYLLEKVAYAVMDVSSRQWSDLRIMEMPERDHTGALILAPNAGCTQRVDRDDGRILLPVRYQRSAKHRIYTSTVALCDFDGMTLLYRDHGTEHHVETGRGLYEPSLASFKGEFFLTLRADDTAYVTKGRDGLHFPKVRVWTFDDGKVLGSYNTQQHWLVIGDGLFLVYTRRGAENDHILRHRAPLYIAQVDPERLVVVRRTERVLLPENHATLGNSCVCHVGADEAWVTCGEGHLRLGQRNNDENAVFMARVTAVP